MKLSSLKKKDIKAPSGLTLVELIIAITLSLIVASGAMFFYFQQSKNSNDIIRISKMQNDFRQTIRLVKKTVGTAGYGFNNSHHSAYFYMAADSVMISFIDEYGVYGCNDTVKIGLGVNTGESLIMTINCHGGGTTHRTIGENISQFSLRYLDNEGNVTATAADVKTIEITIAMEIHSFSEEKNRNAVLQITPLNF